MLNNIKKVLSKMKYRLNNFIKENGIEIINEPKKFDNLFDELIENKKQTLILKIILYQGLVKLIKYKDYELVLNILVNEYSIPIEEAIESIKVWSYALFDSESNLDSFYQSRMKTIMQIKLFFKKLPYLIKKFVLRLNSGQLISSNIIEPDLVFLRGIEIQNIDQNTKHKKNKLKIDNFYISKFKITQKQWVKLMNYNPSEFIDDNFPVNNISWKEIQEYCQRLNILTGKKYRLPTIEEWHYAAQGKLNISSSENNDLTDREIERIIYSIEKYSEKELCSMKEIGNNSANKFGIHDMSGNGWEYCLNNYDRMYYEKRKSKDKKYSDFGVNGILPNSYYVNYYKDEKIIIHHEQKELNNVGFRLVLDI